MEKENGSGIWTETKRPVQENQPAADELRFVDPLETIEVPDGNGERQSKLALAAAALGVCSIVTFPVSFAPVIFGALAILLGIRLHAVPSKDCRRLSKIAIVTGIIGITAALLNMTLFPALFDLFDGLAKSTVPPDLS